MTTVRSTAHAEPSANTDLLTSRALEHGKLLLVTAVRLRNGPRGLQLDDQTCAGICRWAQYFEHVTFAGILVPTDSEEPSSATWRDVIDLPVSKKVSFVPLPMAYRIRSFARQYQQIRAILAREIRRADHMSFTVGYLAGDWAAVAALESIAQRRKFAIWFDRVEQDVLRNALPDLPFPRRLKETLSLPLMVRYHRHLLTKSSLALLQGMDTFEAYARYTSNPACVYDVHTNPHDFIPDEILATKADSIRAGEKLRIVYVGRAAVMKGPLDWVLALAKAKAKGLAFEASWLGDGPLLAEMKYLASIHGLSDQVSFPGFVSDREEILKCLRNAHLLMFCHKTKESPRCLIEALVSGCPIVGYTGAYPNGLVAEIGGGQFSAVDNVDALADNLLWLDRDRVRLAELTQSAARSGRKFDEDTLYRERALLIAKHA